MPRACSRQFPQIVTSPHAQLSIRILTPRGHAAPMQTEQALSGTVSGLMAASRTRAQSISSDTAHLQSVLSDAVEDILRVSRLAEYGRPVGLVAVLAAYVLFDPIQCSAGVWLQQDNRAVVADREVRLAHGSSSFFQNLSQMRYAMQKARMAQSTIHMRRAVTCCSSTETSFLLRLADARSHFSEHLYCRSYVPPAASM